MKDISEKLGIVHVRACRERLSAYEAIKETIGMGVIEEEKTKPLSSAAEIIFRAISKLGECTVNELCELTKINVNGIAYQTRKLAERGIIYRTINSKHKGSGKSGYLFGIQLIP